VTAMALPQYDWRNDAECAKTPEARALFDAPINSYFDRKLPRYDYPTKEHLAYCDRCPVQVECLDYALEHPKEAVGIWGGTSDHQRRQMRNPRSRDRCPNCDGTDVIPENGHELCLRCASSWPVV
jgi:hypothetical protein